MRTLFHWLFLWLNKTNTQKSLANQGQQGSIVIPMAGVLLVGLVLLGSVHLGYMFYMKRELQNAADTAAMSGARALANQTALSCSMGISAAKDNIDLNLTPLGDADKNKSTVLCGVWDPELYDGPMHFAEASNDIDSIYVYIEREQAPIMPFMSTTTISAESIAHAEFEDHIAAFSVGPQLARLDDGILTGLLTTIGLDVKGTTLVDYRGLANVKITPSGLLKQLGIEIPADITVGSLEELLAADLNVQVLFIDIIEASLAAANADGLLTLGQVDLLNAIKLGLEPLNLHLDLLGDAFREALFVFLSTKEAPDSADKKAGLDAEVSLGGILDVMVGIANKEHAVALEKIDINLGILRVESKASVIESPGIGIGGIGTQAHSANVRLFLRICLDLGGCKDIEEPSGPPPLLGGLLGGLLTLKLDLPIVVELINGTGRIENMCHATDSAGRDMIELSVKTETAGICIGDFRLSAPEGSPQHPFSSTMSCTNKITLPNGSTNPEMRRQLADITLLGLNILKLREAVAVPALTSSSSHTFAYHPNISISDLTAKNEANPEQNLSCDDDPNCKMMPDNGNPLLIGDTVERLVNTVLSLLLGGAISNHTPLPPGTNKELATQIWNEHKASLPSCPVNSILIAGPICRAGIFNAASNDIKSSLSGLDGLVGNLLGSVGGILGDLLTLDLGGVLGNTLGLVGDLVGTLLNGCTGVLGILGGSESSCIDNLEKVLNDSSTPAAPTALLVILSKLLSILAAPLNLIGEQILSPLLNALGLKIGQVETTVLYLDCQPNIRLVY